MGNCQAIDTAALVIQHPCGRSEKLYWSVSANEIMKINPGHYVALLISTSVCAPHAAASSASAVGTTTAANHVRVTRIKLLRPTDTLVLGQVYRLITAQEVMKVLSAKKYAKMKKGQAEEKLMSSGLEITTAPRRRTDHHHQTQKTETQVVKPERHSHNRQQQQKTTSSTASTPRPRTWRPSLNSISESAA